MEQAGPTVQSAAAGEKGERQRPASDLGKFSSVEALKKAYAAVEGITFDGAFYRRDIGRRRPQP